MKEGWLGRRMEEWLGDKLEGSKNGVPGNGGINKPIQDGGDVDAPLWLNRLSVTN